MTQTGYRFSPLAVLALVLICAGPASADPVVTGITGQLDAGASVTVVGSGFTEGDFTPFSWDDFESGTLGQELGQPVVGPTWTFLSQSPRPSYSDTRTWSGDRSAHITWPNYSISAFGWSNKGPFRSLYITFWRYMEPEDPGTLPHNFKMMYLYGNGSVQEQNDSPHFMIGAIMPTRPNWQFAVQNHPTVNFPWHRSTSYFSTIGEWQRWEIFVELESSTNASDGYIEGWLDGVRVYRQGGLNLADSDGRFEDFRLGHMFQGHGADDHCYYDDVYVSRSRARVEIGNAPDFEDCTVREIQIPTQWGEFQIDVDLSFSSFPEGELAYLYVVDEDGVANAEGFPIVMGEGGVIVDDPPTIQITSPSPGLTYETDEPLLTLVGTAGDDDRITVVSWVLNGSVFGTAANVSGDWTDWTAADIPLQPGLNEIHVHAVDSSNQIDTAVFNADYTPVDPGPPGQPGQPVPTPPR